MTQKQQVKSAEPVSKRKEEFEDAPMFKLMLLQDDGADVAHGTPMLRYRALCVIVVSFKPDFSLLSVP